MSGERTEPATPKKLKKAREKGQVWRSRDLTSALTLVVGSAVLLWFGPSMSENLRGFTASVFREACSGSPPPPELVLQAALSTVVTCLVPILLAVMFVGVAANLLQIRPLFTLEPIKPQLTRLNPINGLKQIFSVRGLVTALLSLAKIAVVAIVLVWTAATELRNLVLIGRAGPELAIAATSHIVGKLLFRGSLILLGLSLLDVLYQRHRYLKDQRMTKHEVKQEYREAEGDQSQKGERKRLHQELLEQAMIEDVRKADVVIVNPEHIAVALGYRPDEDDAPVVLASGQNIVARKIIEIARQCGIPVLRDVELARNLSEIDVGQKIPEELYEAVAEILRFVMENVDE